MTSTPQEKEFDGTKYYRDDYNGEYPRVWEPSDCDGQPYICVCGHKEFQVFSPKAYSTCVRCVKCGYEAEVHAG